MDVPVQDKCWPPREVSVFLFGIRFLKQVERAQVDTGDITTVINAIIEHHYEKAKQAYRGSLFDLARLDKIADQFNVSTDIVKQKFETTYKSKGFQLPATRS